MDIEKIKYFLSIKEGLKENGVIGFNMWNNDVHLSMESMIKLPNLNIKNLDDEEFPYKISAVVDGIRFFSIADNDDLVKYPEINKLIAEGKQ